MSERIVKIVQKIYEIVVNQGQCVEIHILMLMKIVKIVLRTCEFVIDFVEMVK
jgi:hypothetical protein